MDVWQAIEDQRADVAAMLDGFSAEEWDAPTLCPQWRVRHVVAHMTPSNISMGAFVLRLLRSGGNVNRALAKEALTHGQADPEVLLERFRADIPSRRKPPGPPENFLVDTVVHTQDIRRPLGLAAALPTERLVMAANRLKAMGIGLGTKRRIAGLRLEASDADWSHGDGPEVTGPLEALVMVMAGRSPAAADLSGEGIETLRSRL